LWLRLHRPHHRNDALKFGSALAEFLLSALSPDGKLLVTAGLMRELVALEPASGKILHHVPLLAGSSCRCHLEQRAGAWQGRARLQ
jgi:hypothetical protein